MGTPPHGTTGSCRVFSLPDNIGIDLFKGREDTLVKVDDASICPECKVPMSMLLDGYVCRQCSRLAERPITKVDHGTMEGYYSNSVSIGRNVVGTFGPRYNRSLMEATANYAETRQRRNISDIRKLNYHYEDKKIPDNILIDAEKMFTAIQQRGLVIRGLNRLGVLAACVYYECMREGITKRDSEIAKIFNIRENRLSTGKRILQGFHEKGDISLPLNVSKDTVHHFLDQYFELMCITEKYHLFVYDIIQATSRSNIPKRNNTSKTTTRCAGAIYFLANYLQLPITADIVCENCGISKTTFKKYYNFIMHHIDHPAVVAVFRKHNLPHPKVIRTPRRRQRKR